MLLAGCSQMHPGFRWLNIVGVACGCQSLSSMDGLGASFPDTFWSGVGGRTYHYEVCNSSRPWNCERSRADFFPMDTCRSPTTKKQNDHWYFGWEFCGIVQKCRSDLNKKFHCLKNEFFLYIYRHFVWIFSNAFLEDTVPPSSGNLENLTVFEKKFQRTPFRLLLRFFSWKRGS